MTTSQNKIISNRRSEKDLCFRAFSSNPHTLTHKQIQRHQYNLGQDIIDNFEEIGRVDSDTVNVVQCLTCRTILVRPRRHYNNIRRHLTTCYHKRLERMVSGCMNDDEAASEGKPDKEESLNAKEIFEFNVNDLKAIQESQSTGMIFALSILTLNSFLHSLSESGLAEPSPSSCNLYCRLHAI